MKTDSLRGRTALVTGASSGIGEVTALALAGAGAAVAVGARRLDRVDALADRIRGAGGRAVALDLDVADERSCRAAVERAAAELGPVDVLVNNAGVMLLGPVLGADTEDWRRMIDTNLLGLMYMTHAVLPGMVERGVGDIVNISSVAGRTTRAGSAGYNASKWAVNAFSEALRQEVTKSGVRIALVEPGLVTTELPTHITHPETRDRLVKHYGSAAAPLAASDIADAVLYIIDRPAHVAVNEVLVRPTEQDN
jgi:NADP-dependent 3-hydroxy acid dehydrogenase YdfG